MSSSTILTCKGTFATGVYLAEDQNPNPPPPPPYTLNTCIQYTYSQKKGVGGGGRVESERMFEGQQFTKLSRKYQYC